MSYHRAELDMGQSRPGRIRAHGHRGHLTEEELEWVETGRVGTN